MGLPSTSTSPRRACSPVSCGATGRHAQGGVRRQHAKLCAQVRLEAVLAVEFSGEFLGRLVAEPVADDDEDPAPIRLLEPGADEPLEEVLLVRHPLDPPLLQERTHELAPGQRELGHEPVACSRLHRAGAA